MNEILIAFLFFVIILNLFVSFFACNRPIISSSDKVINILTIWLLPLLGALIVSVLIMVVDPAMMKRAKKGYRKVGVNDGGGRVDSSSFDSD